MKKIILFFFSIFFGIALIIIYFAQTSSLNNQDLKIPIVPAVAQFSLEKAPSESIRGKIFSFSGDVKWESRIATEPVKLVRPIDLQQGEQIVTEENGKIRIEFPNICLIDVLAKSKINFIQTLPANIVIQQSEGIVKYTKIGISPVSIRSLHLLIDQKGGEIIVSVDRDKSIITISAQKGSAAVAFNNLQNVSNVIKIEEGNQFVFNDKTRRGTIE